MSEPLEDRDPRVSPEISACSLFAQLPAEGLRSLSAASRRRRYEAGQALFRVGDQSDAFFVLCSGRVQARVVSGDGRVIVWHVATAGEAPGYLDLLDQRPRSVDAVAMDDVEALLLRASLVREVLTAHPGALMQLAAELAGIVRILSDAAADLVFLDLPAPWQSCC